MLLKPGVENQEYWFMFPGIDKLLHLSIFAFLGFSLLMTFKELNFKYFFLIIFLYGLGTETLQEIMHMGRSFELLDLAADLIGSFLGLVFYKYIFRLFIKYSSQDL